MAKLKKIPFKLWFFGFAVVLLTASLVRLPNVVAEDTAYEKYDRDNDIALKPAVRRYHDEVNNKVNEYIDTLLTDDKAIVNPPDEEIPVGKLCPDNNNVSTYCLSLELVQEYTAFVDALNYHREFSMDPGDDTKYLTGNLRAERYAERSDYIDFQIELARQVMDVTLGVYNELQVFYPLHVKYQELIEDLEDYRDVLANVRRQVERFPHKFVNVSTTECT